MSTVTVSKSHASPNATFNLASGPLPVMLVTDAVSGNILFTNDTRFHGNINLLGSLFSAAEWAMLTADVQQLCQGPTTAVTRICGGDTGLRQLQVHLSHASGPQQPAGCCVAWVIQDITGHLQQEQRRQQQLDQANKELETFVYMASHDLYEPLRKILTFSSMLSEKFSEQLGAQGNQFLGRLIKAAGNMRLLMDRLLKLSRLVNSRPLYEQVSLGTVMDQVRREQEQPLRESGAVLEIGGMPVIAGDRLQLAQLFTNLVENAVKFRAAGRAPHIRITAEKLAPEAVALLPEGGDRSWYEIKVQDNGIGFDARYNERIFQLFQRLHEQSVYPGAGLGLAICKKITDNHSGYIRAEGVPGQGAQFTVYLPES